MGGGQQNPAGAVLVDEVSKIDIDKPRWDQSTYGGRARHFFITTNPLNILKTDKQLNEAKRVVDAYRNGDKLPGMTVDQLWRQKQVYDSAFHPDTGEKQVVIGRMSAQVPCNMTITGCMMTWYKSNSAVVFWQWINQSFNAVVNYTNRSGDSETTNKQLGLSYVMATTASVVTALGLNRSVGMLPPLIGRWVPFSAVAAANMVNTPIMRQKEIFEGIPVYHPEDGTRLGESKTAAKEGIRNVVISRIFMASPSMMGTPIIMDQLDRRGFLTRYPWANAPVQILLCGFFLVFATPLCCAIFPQMSSINVSRLEKELQEKISKDPNAPTYVKYNKGL